MVKQSAASSPLTEILRDPCWNLFLPLLLLLQTRPSAPTATTRASPRPPTAPPPRRRPLPPPRPLTKRRWRRERGSTVTTGWTAWTSPPWTAPPRGTAEGLSVVSHDFSAVNSASLSVSFALSLPLSGTWGLWLVQQHRSGQVGFLDAVLLSVCRRLDDNDNGLFSLLHQVKRVTGGPMVPPLLPASGHLRHLLPAPPPLWCWSRPSRSAGRRCPS